MAETGIIASIIGVAGAGFRLSLILNAVGAELVNADCDVQSIAKGISLFSLMLKQVGKTMEEGKPIASPSAIDTVTEIRDQSQVIFDEIKNMVEMSQGRDDQGHLRSISIAQRVKWCFKKQKVHYLLGQLESLKLSLSIMLQILQMGKAISATREDPSKPRLSQKQMMQERAEIQNMIVVQHWSLVELRKLYHLAEVEGHHDSPGHSPLSQSPLIDDPPPRYDDVRATNGDLKLSIEAPYKMEDKSKAIVIYKEKPLQELDQSLQHALNRENQVLQAPVHDIVDHLLEEWTRTTRTPQVSPRSSPPQERRRSTYYESDDETTSDSEFERSEGIGGRYIEGPRQANKKNVRFHARVDSDQDDSDRDKQHRKRAPKRHVLHSEDDTSTESEDNSSPRSRRSSDNTKMKHVPTQPDSKDLSRRSYGSGSRAVPPENSSGRPAASRGFSQGAMPPRPMPIPNQQQQWQGQPPPGGLRPPPYHASSGGPPRMPLGSPYVPPQYLGRSPQPPPGTYFPGGPGLPMPPNPPRESHRHRRHNTESRQNAAREKDKESASRNLKKGLFGGAAVAGILDILQGLDSL